MDQRRGRPGDYRNLSHRPRRGSPAGPGAAAPRPAGAAEILVAEDCRGVEIRFTVYGLRFTVYGLRFTVYGKSSLAGQAPTPVSRSWRKFRPPCFLQVWEPATPAMNLPAPFSRRPIASKARSHTRSRHRPRKP